MFKDPSIEICQLRMMLINITDLIITYGTCCHIFAIRTAYVRLVISTLPTERGDIYLPECGPRPIQSITICVRSKIIHYTLFRDLCLATWNLLK